MKRVRIEQSRESGFTLIELSIVLVIIGLIVGGVLVGQDLIKAAEMRAAVGQIEKLDAAANTFRTKYNGIPGDMVGPGNFGFTTTGIDTANLGNGVLNRTADDADDFDSESAAFFSQLSAANMITDPITATDFTAANVDTITDYVPASKLGKGNMVLAYGTSGLNYYVVGVPSLTNGAVTYTAGSEMAVIDAFSMDNKMDDGNPTLGRVVAITDMVTLDAGAAAADDICVNTTPTPATYNLGTQARATDTECTIRIRASF